MAIAYDAAGIARHRLIGSPVMQRLATIVLLILTIGCGQPAKKIESPREEPKQLSYEDASQALDVEKQAFEKAEKDLAEVMQKYTPLVESDVALRREKAHVELQEEGTPGRDATLKTLNERIEKSRAELAPLEVQAKAAAEKIAEQRNLVNAAEVAAERAKKAQEGAAN
jgi:hypothetical protein